jgi:two-component system, chemotaxis family, response regulator Rcp1
MGQLEEAGPTAMQAPGAIFLVEDSPDEVLLTQRALRRAGMMNPVYVAQDAESAWRQLQHMDAAAVVLILLELRLLRSGGWDLLDRVVRSPSLSRIPLIVLTGSEFPLDDRRSRELGAAALLKKPIEVAGLLRTLATCPGLGFLLIKTATG